MMKRRVCSYDMFAVPDHSAQLLHATTLRQIALKVTITRVNHGSSKAIFQNIL
jgi:hypothetical protein